MKTKLILKRSSVANKVPYEKQLEKGELALNTADGKLFTKNVLGFRYRVHQTS